MKKKLFACVLLVLVVLQAVFVPVSADGVESGGVSSYRETTIFEDLGMDPGSTSSDFESEVIGGSFSSSEPYVWEILTSCFERSYSKTSFFLYVFNRGYSSMTDSFSVTLADEAGYLFTVSADVIDWTEHCAKICIDLAPSSSWIHTTFTEISIEVYAITCNGRSSRPYVEEYEEGVSTSNLGLIYNISTGKLVKRSLSETLDLNVLMMFDRFSSSDLYVWNQLNSCAFLIPNIYFERFGDLALVRFIYDLYRDVPMLVIERSNKVDSFVSSLFNMVDSDFSFSPRPFFVSQAHYLSTPFEACDTDSGLGTTLLIRNDAWYDYSRYFVFPVDSVNHSSDGDFDFTPGQALRRLDYVKDMREYLGYSVSLQSLLKASSYEHFSCALSNDDLWTTTSFSDSLNWFEHLVFSVLPWTNLVDDSLDNLSAIEIVEDDPSDLSSSEISSLYKIDPYYADSFKSLWDKSVSSDSSLCILRYCMTDYTVYPADTWLEHGKNVPFAMTDGYVCKNAVIDNFQIISFDFNKTIMTDDGPTIVTTTVPVNMSPVSFIGGGESGDSLQDGIGISNGPSPMNPFKGLFKAKDKALNWFKMIFAILGIVVIAIILIKLISFVVAAVRFFQIRKRGSDDPDSPKRRKRHRKKRDRR
ncbi:MAG: hypothetical protein J5958_05500 [Clostridia bacterium]|nr:hypothetical protein [Clostridia bacterium]